MEADPSTREVEALSGAGRELYDAAREASKNAYAPYSGLRVGAALRTRAGGRFSGCNVENASLGLTICAERNAVFAAVASEGPEMRIQEIAVFAEARTASPCGACRQVLAEFGSDARVLFPTDGRVRIVTVTELLPFPFEFRA
jgi:cytidine deaminase